MPKKKEKNVGRKQIYFTDEQKRIAHNLAVAKRNAKQTKVISVRFNIDKDKQVLDYIDKIENKTDYFRQLVIADMNKNKE